MAMILLCCWGRVTCSCGAMSHVATLTSTAIYRDIRDCKYVANSVFAPFDLHVQYKNNPSTFSLVSLVCIQNVAATNKYKVILLLFANCWTLI